MKLRINICLFTVLTILTAGLTFGYVSLRKEYQDLNSQYEKLVKENEWNQMLLENSEAKEGQGLPEETDLSEEQETYAANTFYYVTLDNNEVIAYSGNHKEVCMRTQIDEEELAAALIQELKHGIYLENLPALYEYLENCSS